jgi:hypothetical protein
MPITLVFHGGLFTVLPGSGPARKVDVHMRLPQPVRVIGKDGKRMTGWETDWSGADRIDFETPAALKPEILPIRPISYLIPIDYRGFRKVVGFSGGTVTGAGNSVPRKTAIRLNAVKSRGRREEMLQEFKRFAGVTHHDHDQAYLNGMVQEFFERLSSKELRTWVGGYRIEVKLPVRGTVVNLNGRRRDAYRKLPDGLRIEFPIDPRSTIPHYPMDNPHVLEQPPTL